MSISKNVLGRFLITLGFFLLAILFAYETFAAEGITIVDVRRNIPLSDTDVIYKDFYINTQGESGLKKNLVVTAVRKVTVKDASGLNGLGEISIPVGQLKIISLQNHLAIAREYKSISRDEEPMLEQTGIMTGDQIDLAGAFVDNKKLVYKKPVVEAAPVPKVEAPVAAATAAPVVAPAAPAPALVAPAAPVSSTVEVKPATPAVQAKPIEVKIEAKASVEEPVAEEQSSTEL